MAKKVDVSTEEVLREVMNLVNEAVAIEREACAVEVELRLLGHHLGPIIASAIRRRKNEVPRIDFKPIREEAFDDYYVGEQQGETTPEAS